MLQTYSSSLRNFPLFSQGHKPINKGVFLYYLYLKQIKFRGYLLSRTPKKGLHYSRLLRLFKCFKDLFHLFTR